MAGCYSVMILLRCIIWDHQAVPEVTEVKGLPEGPNGDVTLTTIEFQPVTFQSPNPQRHTLPQDEGKWNVAALLARLGHRCSLLLNLAPAEPDRWLPSRLHLSTRCVRHVLWATEEDLFQHSHQAWKAGKVSYKNCLLLLKFILLDAWALETVEFLYTFMDSSMALNIL